MHPLSEGSLSGVRRNDAPTAGSVQRWLDPDAFAGFSGITTGAASGIGLAIASLLSSHGAHVVILDRNGDGAELAASQLRATGASAVAIEADVSDPNQISAAVNDVSATMEKVDFLVNAAGVVTRIALEDESAEGWNSTFDVNVRGPWLLSKGFLPLLRKSSKGAAIVNISTVGAFQPHPGAGAYTPSKAALVSLTRQIALEWAHYGIRANVVSPGSTRTPMASTTKSREALEKRLERIPAGRIAEPDEIACVTAFLLSPGASYVTGQDVMVDGGLSSGLFYYHWARRSHV